MNACARVVVLSLSIVGLSACAGSHEMVRQQVQPQPALEPGEVRIQRDAAYMAQVERMALRRGVHVEWVNPPNKHLVAVE